MMLLFAGWNVASVEGRGISEGQLSLLDPAAESTSVLVETVKELLKAEQLSQAVPFLKELLVRLEGDEDKKARQTRAYSLYELGHCQMKLGAYSEAATDFVEFADTYTNDVENLSARVSAAQCLTILQDWPAVEKQSSIVLQEKMLPDELKLSVTKVQAESLYRQEKWDAAIRPLIHLYRMARKDQVKGGAAVMLVTCYVRENDFDSLFSFLPHCDSGARHDVGLNVALLEAGDDQYKRKEFLKALLLYRLVIGKQDLIAYYEQLLKEIRSSIKPPVAGKISLDEQKAENEKREQRYARKAKHLQSIRDFADYDMDVVLRIAQCYADLGRNWPAYAIYTHIYKDFPESPLAEQSRFSAFATMLSERDWPTAFADGYNYIEVLPQGQFIDDVTLNLMQVHMQLGELDKAFSLGKKALALSPNHKYIDQIKYIMGYIRFVKWDYAEAADYFGEVLRRWPDSKYYESAEYWRAMSQLFLNQFAEAAVSFEAYLTNPKYAEHRYAEDATYRKGIAQYGAEQYPESEKTFRYFVEAYPKSLLRSEAYSMLGDLRGEEGDFVRALAFFEQAISAAQNMQQRNYPTFRVADVYYLDKRYGDIVERMDDYLRKWGREADVATACNWQGKAYKAMEPPQFEQAVAAYIRAINEFGNEPDLASVDAILEDMIADYTGEEWVDYRDGMRMAVESELTKARASDKITLRMRYETLMAGLLKSPERDAYVEAVVQEELVEQASPLALVLMAREGVKRGQFELVHAAYDRYLKHFEVSANQLYVMNAQLEALAQEKRYDEGIALTEEILKTFGHSPSVAWAWKRRGDLYREQKRYAEAEETYNYLLGIREWRGPLTPEGHYWLGICKMEQGKYQDAYAHFQRIYVLYGEYGDWLVRAYEKSIECLKALGETEYIINTYREMVQNSVVAATPEGQEAQRELDRLAPTGEVQ